MPDLLERPLAHVISLLLALGIAFALICGSVYWVVESALRSEPPPPVRPWFAYEQPTPGPERMYWPMRTFSDASGNAVGVDVPNNVVVVAPSRSPVPGGFTIPDGIFSNDDFRDARLPLTVLGSGGTPSLAVASDALVEVDARRVTTVIAVLEPGFAVRFLREATTSDGYRLKASVPDIRAWLAEDRAATRARGE